MRLRIKINVYTLRNVKIRKAIEIRASSLLTQTNFRLTILPLWLIQLVCAISVEQYTSHQPTSLRIWFTKLNYFARAHFNKS